nr:hypothetical protein [Corynebacterium provencense]
MIIGNVPTCLAVEVTPPATPARSAGRLFTAVVVSGELDRPTPVPVRRQPADSRTRSTPPSPAATLSSSPPAARQAPETSSGVPAPVLPTRSPDTGAPTKAPSAAGRAAVPAAVADQP